MADELTLTPAGAANGRIRPPGSKSLTNRAFVCAALASGSSILRGVLDSEDTRVMIEGLRTLGINIQHDLHSQIATVDGCGGSIPAAQADLFIANSGTTIRFLSAMLGAGRGTYRLHGVDRMHQRPIGDLVAALRTLGVDATAESPGDCPPIQISTQGLRGGVVDVRGDVSSQFLSGLLMAGPYAVAPIILQVEGELVSRPYVEMTLAVMRSFGVDVQSSESPQRFLINAPQRYQGQDYSIEPDASAASYFWAAAAITGGTVTVEGLTPAALQGDVGFVEVLRKMGCEVESCDDSIRVTGRPLRGIDIDMNAISDTVQTLAAVALFAEGPTRVRGVAHNRHKETDRIGDLACELRKLGAEVLEHEDGLTINPGVLRGARIETYNDHRMAMSLALVGLKVPGVTLLNPGCTVKTYPNYFDDLSTLLG